MEDAAQQSIPTVTFEWARAGDAYTIHGPKVVHKGGGESPYRPVVGDLTLIPGNGKVFYEITTNTDACKLGLCTKGAFRTVEELEVELGKKWDTSTYGEAPSCDECWMFNCQTSTVEVNGEERKRLWRLSVPVSGGNFGFLVDTDEGRVQLFFKDVYQGVVFETSLGLRGKALHPCVGLEGMDMNNRNIGEGNNAAFVTPLCKAPPCLTEFRNEDAAHLQRCV
ncbi:uncharacterized protein Tco025E_02979 [Trypanosoma conorhini]|uniref:B30.2/SPRY domain-containing protein n=1 Tax=Trypanosoma conorhini TaxID=83891 RepID=A0A3R7MZ68_9TRYP|nr:uncharacterized protein Tco025E_02979 [Trypanosoma conorhini]RNF22913.1 hypothetical protein Tco025E_02979 [Trypanosoma conorhini]